MVGAVRTGATPHEIVLRRDKVSLLRYTSNRRRYRPPLLLVPALISRAYILDLYPGGSFAEFLVARGWDVFLIDWGIPGDEDVHRGLEYYLGDALPRCLARVREAAPGAGVNLLGYCMGGTLAAAYAALAGLRAPDTLIALAAPIDFAQGGILTKWCAKPHCDIDRIVETFGNVPAHVIEATFAAIKPTAGMHAAVAYAQHRGDPEFERGFFAMDRWVSEWIPFPGEAARQWVTWFYQENRLFEDRLSLLGADVRLGAIAAPLLAVCAAADHIAPPRSVAALAAKTGSADKRVLTLAGGHVGMVAGRSAKNILWPAVEAWLGEHSERHGS